jgi:hypothetical protein
MAREDLSADVGMGGMLGAFAQWNDVTATKAMRELIDNSLDASAHAVSIAWEGDRFTIEDDGHGTAEVKRILTPFNHGEHTGTKSGRYGFGGTASLAWIAAASGRVKVDSYTGDTRHMVTLDYGECVRTDRLGVDRRSAPSTKPPGTRIAVDGARSVSAHQIGASRRDVSFAYAPALRAGIAISINGKPVEAFAAPEVAKKKLFRFTIDGCDIKGFCAIVKPGKPNPVKGWAFAYGHRFMGVFCDPLGDLESDINRIYGEVVLPKSWRNIGTTKDGFVTPPDELMEKVREASLWAIEQARTESQSIEVSGAIAAAQGILDGILGAAEMERRDPAEVPEPGTKEPGNTGKKRNYKKTQPGDKRRSSGGPRRIRLQWSPDLGKPYEIRPGSNNTVFVLLDDTDPANRIYRGVDSGPFLADIVLAWIAGDWSHRPGDYRPLFPDIEAEGVVEMFASLRGKVQGAARDAA